MKLVVKNSSMFYRFSVEIKDRNGVVTTMTPVRGFWNFGQTDMANMKVHCRYMRDITLPVYQNSVIVIEKKRWFNLSENIYKIALPFIILAYILLFGNQSGIHAYTWFQTLYNWGNGIVEMMLVLLPAIYFLLYLVLILLGRMPYNVYDLTENKEQELCRQGLGI